MTCKKCNIGLCIGESFKIATPNPSCDLLSTYDGTAHLSKTGMSQKRFILLCFLQHTAE